MNPTLLITCIRCAQLHVPASSLALHPVCSACSPPNAPRAGMR